MSNIVLYEDEWSDYCVDDEGRFFAVGKRDGYQTDYSGMPGARVRPGRSLDFRVPLSYNPIG